MARNEKKNQLSLGKIIGAIILFAIIDSDMGGFALLLVLPLAIFWLITRILKKQGGRSRRNDARMQQATDDCPKPICFHKDKGMHHVIRGRRQDPWDLPNREIDPWDRPDIDIRKYQRR